MTRLAIIPARGGSKRIPHKNIKHFLGKPIIGYSIEAAMESNLFDEVMVSTDDKEIGEVAKKFKATVPFYRSTLNANDFATTLDVIKEVIECYKNQDKVFDEVCCIYATAPFVTSYLLSETYKIFSKGFDTVFPVVAYSFPIQRALRIKDGKATMFQSENANTRSQDLEKSYHDTGQFYWLNPDILGRSDSLYTDNTSVYEVSQLNAQDIDTIDDWKIAEYKYQHIYGKS